MIAQAVQLEGQAEKELQKGFAQKRTHDEIMRKIDAIDSFAQNRNSVIFGEQGGNRIRNGNDGGCIICIRRENFWKYDAAETEEEQLVNGQSCGATGHLGHTIDTEGSAVAAEVTARSKSNQASKDIHSHEAVQIVREFQGHKNTIQLLGYSGSAVSAAASTVNSRARYKA